MDTRYALAVAVALLVIFEMTRSETEDVTAGDEDSNAILDGIDDLKNTIVSGWPDGAEAFRPEIMGAASVYGVPVEILVWLLWKESRYSLAIITGAKRSRVGAMGIAQFMPGTAVDELGSVAAALDPTKAIPGAARYLAKLYRMAGESWAGALAAYNWGIGNVQRKGLAQAPAETRDYYTTILAKANAAGGGYK